MDSLDLFTPAVPESRFHPNFRTIRNQWTVYDKDVLRAWAEDFSDRDGKFVIEFQTTFNSAFWELYLFACLKYLQLPVDFRYPAPDFLVTRFWNEFTIEAAIASNAADEPGEWMRDMERLKSLDRDCVVDEATIRLANTLTAKHEKYRSSYELLPHVRGRPFVLAIAPFEQPYFEVQNDQAMRRVLYGYDRPVLKFPRGKNRAEVLRHEWMRSIRKKSGAEIPLGFFMGGEMSDISAVIFSNTATAGKVRALSKDPNPNVWFRTLRFNKHGDKPLKWGVAKPDYFESLLDGLNVFHNPHARHPLPWDLFDRQGVTQHTYCRGDLWPRFKATHGSLIQRTVVTFRPKA